ncbi:MAG: DUF423 domain-containing protein [Chitinophagaceae bacterium]|nr:DUF423 domain-containing protein [Chitinophagaceae bacterium]
MHKYYISIASFLGAVTVALGAFGAHALKKLVPEQMLMVYDTAVRYQFYHLLALALVGILYKSFTNSYVKNAGVFFLLGILFFSGSLYLLTYKAVIGSDGFGWVGPITPIGGLFFIIGWILLGIGTKKG